MVIPANLFQMNLPPIDLSTVLFLFYFIAVLLGSRGLTTHLRDGADPTQEHAHHTSTSAHHHIL